jgi:DNA polymerase I-like protein with 3'-5' exonuclease and polymerase domains
MALFEVPVRAGRLHDSKVAQKANAKSRAAAVKVKDGGGISGRISTITAMVEKHLGKYADKYITIRDESELHDYISACIDNGVIAIDTETNGLDPILDDIVGVCIYTIGRRGAYIPINHVSYITMELVPNQLSKSIVASELTRIADANIDVIMFNAKFDTRVIRNQLGVYLRCTWDCYLGARLLNENEGAGNNGLKKLHQKYVLDGVGDAFSFDDLFKGIPFSQIPIKVGYLYAARDPEVTFELYEFQKEYLGDNAEKYGLQDVAWVFHNVEMPCVEVVCDMEDNGITFDFEYGKVLSEKYHKLLDDKVEQFYDVCRVYQDKIDAWTDRNPNNKLDNPINIASSTQIAILLYDILKIEPPDPKNPRGTGVEILSKIDNPLCKAILEYREVSKLLSTYIDKLPDCVNPKDGRIHCSFNQYGADTGRFSSSDPNQNWALVA